MSRELIDGVWVIKCDWVDPNTSKPCGLGVDGEPAMFVDPEAGSGTEKHFQCGRHHGVIPQKEQKEFQLPEGHKLNEEVLKPGTEMSGTSVEEVEDEPRN
jgi:hypothetical protein